jgi:hypothetical protein
MQERRIAAAGGSIRQHCAYVMQERRIARLADRSVNVAPMHAPDRPSSMQFCWRRRDRSATLHRGTLPAPLVDAVLPAPTPTAPTHATTATNTAHITPQHASPVPRESQQRTTPKVRKQRGIARPEHPSRHLS